MISTEKTFDILPYVCDLYEKLDIKGYLNKNKKKFEGKGIQEAGQMVFMQVIKNSAKVKDEFFNIVAILEEKQVEEVKKQGLVATINTINEVFSDKELMDFFKSAME